MDQTTSSHPSPRVILYYPTISIPNIDWLRRAIFYFDKVASIVPASIYFSGEIANTHIELPPEIEFLQKEGVFEPIAPDELVHRSDKAGWTTYINPFIDDFKTMVHDARFRARLNSNTEKRFVRVHRGKLNSELFSILSQEGLLQEHDETWYLVEETTALLYMSMLAQVLADTDLTRRVVPGTDRQEYQELLYYALAPEKEYLRLGLHNVLPMPREDVSFDDILKFKEKRKAELIGYRATLDKLQEEITSVDNVAEVQHKLDQFKDAQYKSLQDLSAALNDSGIATIWGTMEALIQKDMTLFAGAAAYAGYAVSPVAGMTTMGVAGVIKVGKYRIERRNDRRAKLRESPQAYLYQGQKEGILTKND